MEASLKKGLSFPSQKSSQFGGFSLASLVEKSNKRLDSKSVLFFRTWVAVVTWYVKSPAWALLQPLYQ